MNHKKAQKASQSVILRRRDFMMYALGCLIGFVGTALLCVGFIVVIYIFFSSFFK